MKLSPPLLYCPIVALALSAFTSSADAQILLQDTFTNPATGNLSGRTPDSADAGSALWVVGSGSDTVGSGVATFTNLDNGNLVGLAYDGTNFANSTTYTLSGDFTFTNAGGGTDNWYGIGFTNASPGLGSAFNNGAAWMLNKGTTHADVQWFANVFGSSGNNSSAGLDVATLEIKLALDNTGAGTLTYYIGPNSGSLTTLGTLSLTTGQVDAITGVGFFGQSGASGTVDNFTLTGPVTVPEPSTWAMMLAGFAALAVVQRKRFLKA